MPAPTPFQTVGPYFEIAMPATGVVRLADDRVAGEPILIQGLVRDGAGVTVPDAVVETWQADAAGRYPDSGEGFVGFARMPTAPDGSFSLETIRRSMRTKSSRKPVSNSLTRTQQVVWGE